MPQHGLTIEQMQEAVDAVAKYGSQNEAARQLGIPRPTFLNRYRKGIAKGLDQAIVHPAPQGHTVKGVSTMYDAGGNIAAQWVKTALGPSLESIAEAIRDALDGYSAPPPSNPPSAPTDASLATVYPLADWHIGLLAWHEEAGEDWDLNIAKDIIGRAMRRLIAQSPPSEQGVVLGLGDLLHADNYENRTTRSGHALDVDGRYPKVLRVATELVIEAIDLALTKHARVLVRLIPGNHDDQSAIAVSLALAMRYSNDPRVTVDDSASRFWWWRWGKVFLGAAHGDQTKMQDLPLVMAARNPDDWGASRYRMIMTGHIHHRSKINAAKEYCGVEVESFNTPTARDAYGEGHGYTSGRSVHSITFDRDLGEVGRVRSNIVGALA